MQRPLNFCFSILLYQFDIRLLNCRSVKADISIAQSHDQRMNPYTNESWETCDNRAKLRNFSRRVYRPWQCKEASGKRIQRSLILPNTPRVGGMKIVNKILRNIGQPSILRTGSSSKEQSKVPRDPSLTKKFKKSPTKEGVLRSL